MGQGLYCKEKKGEMTSQQLVYLSLLIAGFVILLFVYFQLKPGDIDREVCHESVILRGTLPDSLELKDLTPLKCKTRKACITDKTFGKGDCQDELGEKYDAIRVSKNEEKKEQEIKMFIAREMADCWSMMGEGKVQVFTREFKVTDTVTRRCSVCTRIAFDKSIKEKTKEIQGIGEYLISHNVPNRDIKYWEFLSAGSDIRGYDPLEDKYSTEQKAIVFMEVDKTNAPSWIYGVVMAAGTGAIGAKGGAVIGSFVAPVGGTVVGGVVGFIGGAVVGAIIGTESGEDIEEQYITEQIGSAEYAAGSFFIDYGESIKELECDSLESIP